MTEEDLRYMISVDSRLRELESSKQSQEARIKRLERRVEALQKLYRERSDFGEDCNKAMLEGLMGV